MADPVDVLNKQLEQDPTKQPGDKDADLWSGAKSADEDQLFLKNWEQLGGRAEALGITKEQAWQQYNSAGRPRGHNARVWQDSLTNPANAPALAPDKLQPEADAEILAKLKRDAGIGGPSADATMSLDPTAKAVAEFRGAGAQARDEQMAALQGLKTAGDPAAAAQAQLITQLQEAARGGGPSAAQALFQLALGRAVGGINAGAAGVRGGNAAAASRNAGLAGGQMLREGVGQSAALRAQEQQAAQGLLGATTAQARQGDFARAAAVSDVAAQVRGMDVGQAQTLVGLTMAQQQLQQAKQQAATNTALSLLQFDAGLQQQGIVNQLGRAGLAADVGQSDKGIYLGYDQLAEQRRQAQQQFWTQMIGSILSGGGALAGGLIGRPAGAAAATSAGTAGGNGLQAPGTYIPSTNPASDSYWGL